MAVSTGDIVNKLINFADPSRRGLDVTHKAVLRAIADHLWKKSEAWPGYGTIAHFAGCNRNAAITTVKKLAARGILVKTYRGEQESNSYTIDTTVLRSLITKKRYQERADHYLSKLPSRDGCAENTSISQIPPQYLADTTPVSRRYHPSISQIPENPITTPSPSHKAPKTRGATQKGMGEGNTSTDDSPSEFIKNEEIAEAIQTCEMMIASGEFNQLVKSTIPAENVARSICTVFKRVHAECGRYPDGRELAYVINDKEFKGLTSLSWGLLTGKGKSDTFVRLLVENLKRRSLATRLAHPTQDDLQRKEADERKRNATLAQKEATVTPLAEDDEARFQQWLLDNPACKEFV